MRPRVVIAAGCAGILVFDLVGSLSSEALGFSYGLLAPVSFALYALVGFLAARAAGDARTGMLGGLAVAATDATLGWALSAAIGPGMPAAGDRDAALLVATAIGVAVTGAVLGLVAGLVGRRSASGGPLHRIGRA